MADKSITSSDKRAEQRAIRDALPRDVYFGAYTQALAQKLTLNGEPQTPAPMMGAPEESEKNQSQSVFASDLAPGKKPWSSTPEGRAAIRLFSRGIMGAAFFAMGQMWNTRSFAESVKDYHPSNGRGVNNLPQRIAALIDNSAGRIIRKTTEKIGYQLFRGNYSVVLHDGVAHNFDRAQYANYLGQRAVTFRDTRSYHDDYQPHGAEGRPNLEGRSIGEEVVGITLDFAMASMGDAIGRNLVDILDPNVEKTWIKDGKILPKEFAKALGKSVWTILTFNQGEDWAVSIPYAFYMRFQRRVLDKIFPGFKYDSDRALNGGSFSVDDTGKINGNYAIPGALDLHGRFAAYNVMTSMYREIYREVGKFFDQIIHPEKHADEVAEKQKSAAEHPHSISEKLLNTAQAVGRFFMRHIIKAGIYMQAAVPFFWITRTPQSKQMGMLIHPDKGPMMFLATDANGRLVNNPLDGTQGNALFANGNYWDSSRHTHMPDPRHANGVQPLFYGDFRPFKNRGHTDPTVLVSAIYPDPNNRPINPVAPDAQGNRYAIFGQHNTWHDPLTNLIGRANQGAVEAVGTMAKALGANPEGEFVSSFVPRFVRASISYTPYMYVKGEMNRLYGDNNIQMDMATDRFSNGVFALNWSETKAGIKEIRDTFMRRPLTDPDRAVDLKEQQKKNPHDASLKPYAQINHDPTLANEKLHVTFSSVDGNFKNRLNKPQTSSFSSTPKEGWKELLKKDSAHGFTARETARGQSSVRTVH